SRLQIVKLTIEHVRKPGQRMPIARVKSPESPGGSLPAQACLHVRIFGHILLVIINQKFVGKSRQINGRSEEHTSELQSRVDLVCRLLLEKKKKRQRL